MTEAVVVHTNQTDSLQAGRSLGLQIVEKMSARPDVVILFASARYEKALLIQTLQAICHPGSLLGCTSSGEFTSKVASTGQACAVALHSEDMQFRIGIGHRVREDYRAAAQELYSSFESTQTSEYAYRAALLFIDSLSGSVEAVVEELIHLTRGTHEFFGSGASDHCRFESTPVFYGEQIVEDAVVGLEILSHKPLGVGVRHDWQPATSPMFVTETRGRTIFSIDDRPAVDVFREHAFKTEQDFDEQNPLTFFVRNLIGVNVGVGYKLRVPVMVTPDGAVVCTTEVPEHSTICLMSSNLSAAIASAEKAARLAYQRLYGGRPVVALFFDCPASRMRMPGDYAEALMGLQRVIADVPYIGCNTYGQIVRTQGQYANYHNCTPLVCIIPE